MTVGIAVGPEVVVPAPRLVPAPTGLLQASTVVDMDPGAFAADPALAAVASLDAATSERWLAGVKYAPESVAVPTILDACAVNTGDGAGYTRRPPRYHHALIIEVADQCGAFGWKANEYEDRALRALLVKEGNALEEEFEQGALFPSEPHLSDGVKVYADGGTTNGAFVITSSHWTYNDVGRTVTGAGIGVSATVQSINPGVSATLSVASTATAAGVSLTVTNPNFVVLNAGAAVSPSVAFALLQEAIATADIGMGVIHCTAFLAERWGEAHALRFNTIDQADPRRLLTSDNGNVVCAGNGYEGIGADGTGGTVQSQGAAAAVQWAYATEPLTILRASTPTLYPFGATAEDRLRQALDRGTNLVTYRQSRPFVVEWGGLCHAAVKVNATQ